MTKLTTSSIITSARFPPISPDSRSIEHIRPSSRLPIPSRPNNSLPKRTEGIQSDHIRMLDDIGLGSWIGDYEE